VTLSELEKVRVTRGLLDALRWRLLDKPGPIIDSDGRYYSELNPHDCCAIGSIAHPPDKKEIQSGAQPMPNAMGMAFLVQAPDHGPLVLEVDGRFDLAHAYIPNFEEQRKNLVSGVNYQRLADAYIRHTVTFAPARFEIPTYALTKLAMYKPQRDTVREALAGHREQVSEDPRVYWQLRRKSGEGRVKRTLKWSENITDQDTLNDAVRQQLFKPGSGPLPYELDLHCRLRPAPTQLRNDSQHTIAGAYLVEIFLVNETANELAQRYNLSAHRVMDVNLRVRILAGEHQRMRFPLATEDCAYESEQDSDGYGITCALVREASGTLRTESLPMYEQPRLEAPNLDEAGMRHAPLFESLASDPFPILDDLVNAKRAYAREWSQKLQRRSPGSIEAGNALVKFENEVLRVAEGVQLLRENKKLLRAFRLMNESMRHSMNRKGKQFREWRLFQLGFLLTQARSIVQGEELAEQSSSKEPPTEEDDSQVVDTLCHPAGSGKTEARQAVFIWEMFYQRMTGRHWGTSVWQRYPSRMLVMQQLQRLVPLVAAAERIRVREQMSGFPFTIGYFSGGTPNDITSPSRYSLDDFLPAMAREREKRNRGALKESEERSQERDEDPLLMIGDCPYCDSKVRVALVREIFRVKHVCDSVSCWSNRNVPPDEKPYQLSGELGIYVTDEECYRYLPTILIGTKDKTVVMALRARFSNFFGAAAWYCPDHGHINRDHCTYKNVRRMGTDWSDPFDCVNNQDASAVRLFQLPPMQRPGFTRLDDDEIQQQKEEFGNCASHYDSALEVSQCSYPGGRPPKITAATATTRDIENHVNHLFARPARRFPVRGAEQDESFYSRVERDPENNEILVRRFQVGALPGNTKPNRIAEWACDLNRHYHELITETAQRLHTQPEEVCRAFNIDATQAVAFRLYLRGMHGLSMIYVRRLQDADHVMQRLAVHREKMEQTGRPGRVHVRLDADTPLWEFQEAIGKIQAHHPEAPVHELVATAAFQSGMDIDRLNFLCIVGWLASVTEHIQVSGRCGRLNPGIVVVALDAHQRFQASAFANFREYHRFLEKLIEPVPINRFAERGMLRTLPGIFSALYLHWARRQPFARNSLRMDGRGVSDLLNKAEVAERFAQKIAATYVERADHLKVFSTRQIEEALDHALLLGRRLIGFMRRVHTSISDKYFREVLEEVWGQGPMTSLRDVERQLEIKPATLDDHEVLTALGAFRRGEKELEKIPYGRLFYENFLLGGVVTLKEAFALVVSCNSDTDRAKSIDANLVCEIALERLTRFEEEGGARNEPVREMLAQRQVAISTPTTIYVSPFPLLLFCPKCKLVEVPPRLSRTSLVMELARRIIKKPRPHIPCENCFAPLRQLPYVQCHECGYLAPIELPRVARHCRVAYIEGDSLDRSRWIDFDTGKYLGRVFPCMCPQCAVRQVEKRDRREERRKSKDGRHPPYQSVRTTATKLSSGRKESFFPQLLQYISLSPDTAIRLSAFRSVVSKEEAGRGILCGLLGLQQPQEIRENLRLATGARNDASGQDNLAAERAKLEAGLKLLRQQQGLQSIIELLETQKAEVEGRMRQASGLFAAADAYVNETELLNRIGSDPRTGEAALLGGEFRQISLDTEDSAKNFEQNVFVAERRAALLRDYGVCNVRHIDNLEIVIAAIGFTRQAAEPHGRPDGPMLRFNAFIDEGRRKIAGKLTEMPIVALPIHTEGLQLQFDPCRILQWGIINLDWPPPAPEVLANPQHAHSHILKLAPALVGSPNQIRQRALVGKDRTAIHLLGLQHTLGHMLMRTASFGSGYERNSLMEYLLPAALSVIICVSPRKNTATGGLRTLYAHGLRNWFEQAVMSSMTCIFDPRCSEHDGGSCNGCVQTPIGCETFNHGLSKSYLQGGAVHDTTGQTFWVKKGYWT
jgi:hypothetical protein